MPWNRIDSNPNDSNEKYGVPPSNNDHLVGKAHTQNDLLKDLKDLHEKLLLRLDLDLLQLLGPQGWRLDFTESAACELERGGGRRHG